MSKHGPGAALAVLGGFLFLAVFITPPTGSNALGGTVVTAEVKDLEASLARLKSHTDAGNDQRARSELGRLETMWWGLVEGLSVRRLEATPSAAAFEQSLAEMKSAVGQDRAAAAQALRSATTAFAQLKRELQGAAVLEPARFLPVVGGLLLLWILPVLATPRLVQRFALKH